MSDMKKLRITESLTEIKKMSKQKFTDILNKRKCPYLKGKRKSKGKEIKYEELEMAEYLGPTNIILTIEEKQKLFGIRN